MKSQQTVPPETFRIRDPKTTRKGLQVFVGILLSAYLVQLVGLPVIYFLLIAHGHFSIMHLLLFAETERAICYFLPLAGAAMLCRHRPYVSLGMLFGFGFCWVILAAGSV